MTFKPWLLAAAVYSGVATAQSPTMEQRTEAFAEVSAAMTSGNQTGAADALIAVIEDPNWAMFEGEAHARLAVQLNKLDLPLQRGGQPAFDEARKRVARQIAASAAAATAQTAPPIAVVPLSGLRGKGIRIMKEAIARALAASEQS